jgi:hypothetical protein
MLLNLVGTEGNMQILFHGGQSSEEAADSVLSILKLFKERYGISNFRDVALNIVLVDENGDEVELVDGSTSEVLGIFEVYKSSNMPDADLPKGKGHLELVVDNTKK